MQLYHYQALKGIQRDQEDINTSIRSLHTEIKTEDKKINEDVSRLREQVHDVSRGSREFVATAYTYTGDRTATGTRTHKGVVAVDPRVIPLNSTILIRCEDYPAIDGVYKAEDTGKDIRGDRVDIYMDSREECIKFGNRRILVYIQKG